MFFKRIYFDQLFGSKTSIAAIQEAASQVFYYIQMAMIYDIILSISRLTDPPYSRGKRNLSLLALSEEVEDAELKEEIRLTVSKLDPIVASLKAWRNRKLAHNCHERLTSDIRLPPLTQRDLAEASNLIGVCLNKFNKKFGDTTVSYGDAITEHDGDSLILYLRYGLYSWKRDKANLDVSVMHELKRQKRQELEESTGH